MAEVRFTIKGDIQETIFSPVRDGDEFFLYSSNNGIESKYKLQQDQETKIFKLEDYGVFEEPQEVIEDRLVGLSEEWMDEVSQGFESESDMASVSKPGYGPDDIFVENKPFSLKQIFDLINDGDIELSPDFQRNFIWDNTRQSRLIESIFLGLPLPSIYLSQYDDGRLTIVDGLQRIMTIKRFLTNNLRLNNLEYMTECNGKTYEQLKTVFSPLRLRRFGQTQIMCFVIDYRSPNKLKFDLFRRLNTGGKPLNNQEIRNCLSRHEVRMVLKDMVENDFFKKATGNSVKGNRMETQEAAMRFLYFYNHYIPEDPVKSYNGNMDDTLDSYVETLNETRELQKYIQIYKNSLEDAYTLFGENTFRKKLPYQSRRSPINKSLMLVITVLLAYFRNECPYKIDFKNNLTDELAEMINNDVDLLYALTWSTNSKTNLEYVFNTLKKDLFDKHLLCHENIGSDN